MIRFFVLFFVLLAVSFTLMISLLAQYGVSLLDPRMQTMALVCVLVAAYVAWRITTILNRRKAGGTPKGAGAGALLSGFIGAGSQAQRDREARVAARRRKLIAEGKLEAEPADLEPPPPPEAEAPARVASSASVKEKMAARAERVRRAREEGKI